MVGLLLQLGLLRLRCRVHGILSALQLCSWCGDWASSSSQHVWVLTNTLTRGRANSSSRSVASGLAALFLPTVLLPLPQSGSRRFGSAFSSTIAAMQGSHRAGNGSSSSSYSAARGTSRNSSAHSSLHQGNSQSSTAIARHPMQNLAPPLSGTGFNTGFTHLSPWLGIGTTLTPLRGST